MLTSAHRPYIGCFVGLASCTKSKCIFHCIDPKSAGCSKVNCYLFSAILYSDRITIIIGTLLVGSMESLEGKNNVDSAQHLGTHRAIEHKHLVQN